MAVGSFKIYSLQQDGTRIPVAGSTTGGGDGGNSGVAEDSLKLGGKAPEYYLQPRNLLDNSYWKNPKEIVNQRGQEEYTSGGYRIDRWRCWEDGITRIDDGSLYVGVDLYQYISDMKVGEKVTFAAKLLDGTVTVLQGEIVHEGDNTDENEFIKLVYQTDGLIACILKASYSFVWACLYEGSYTADTLPPYVPKGYAVELEECRRYYRALYRLGFSPYNVSTSTRYYRIPIEPPMRDGVIPTVTVIGLLERPLNSWTDTGAEVSVFSATVHEFTLQAVSDITAEDCSLMIDEIIISSEL